MTNSTVTNNGANENNGAQEETAMKIHGSRTAMNRRNVSITGDEDEAVRSVNK